MGAHCGYHKTYNRIASLYFWHSMSRDIKGYVLSCDICQKAKPRQVGSIGLLQPIPIPSIPFEVISMDFITELPVTSGGFNSILVVVDKLTKFAIFVPTQTTVNETETAKLIFKHVISKYGIPKQIISDRDSRWSNDFWLEICNLIGTKRALTTAYHPQADGQTEIMNRFLEVALRCYVNIERNDWDTILDQFAAAYNSTSHDSTRYEPAFLLYGYLPRVTVGILEPTKEAINRQFLKEDPGLIQHEGANQFVMEFDNHRQAAKDFLSLAHRHQERGYNKGKRDIEFDVGDLVLIDPHALHLLRSIPGVGRKLQMKFDGPFEIQEKLGKYTYKLKLPSSYGIHPVLNSEHLEPYIQDATGLERPRKQLHREDFDKRPEYEVEAIVDEKLVKRGKRSVPYYLIKWKGFSDEENTWESKKNIRNAPEVLKQWTKSKGSAIGKYS